MIRYAVCVPEKGARRPATETEAAAGKILQAFLTSLFYTETQFHAEKFSGRARRQQGVLLFWKNRGTFTVWSCVFHKIATASPFL